MSMEDKKAIHYNITDEMTLSIITLFRRGQAVFEEVSELLYKTRDVCENLPVSVREQELIMKTQDLNHKLSNYDCEYEGQAIVSSMQRLIDGLYEVENTYMNEIRENSLYFQSDVCRSGREPDYVGSGFIGVIDLEKYGMGDKLRGMDALYGYMKDNIFGAHGITSEVNYLTDKEIELIYYEDMVQFIMENYSKEYEIFTMQGIPSSVRQIAWEKIKIGIAERVAIYKEATQLRTQLLSDNTVCKWNDRFIDIENTIELIEIFHRNDVDTAEEKSFFLAQVYAETEGGNRVRERTYMYEEGNVELSKEFEEYTAVLCILQNASAFLPEEQLVNWHDGGTEEDFINVISQAYVNNRGEVCNNTYYTANNITEHRSQEIKHIIGENTEDSVNGLYNEPFRVSDIIQYRGGGALQITYKENYYSFALYVEQQLNDAEAAQDIRENGCYSEYIIDEYCLESAEWFYFHSTQKVEDGDTFDMITEKIYGGSDPRRRTYQEAIYNVLSK